MKSVGIIDYDVGNLDSIARAIEECGGRPVLARQGNELAGVAAIILPGVGAFSHGMRNLRERGFEDALHDHVVDHQIPVLGVCLGMQLLATSGAEGGAERGLGWIQGEVVRLEPTDSAERVPHIGWNEVYPDGPSPLFRSIDPGGDFYFVHSYHLACLDDTEVAARTPAFGGFASAVSKEHVMGVQFHPEKSQRVGFQLIKNFLAI